MSVPVECDCQWVFTMCEQGSSVYFVYFIPLFKNKLNRVAYVQRMCD